MVALPFFFAVILPFLSTLATLGLLLSKLFIFMLEGTAFNLILNFSPFFMVSFFSFRDQPSLMVTVNSAVAPFAVVTVIVAFPAFFAGVMVISLSENSTCAIFVLLDFTLTMESFGFASVAVMVWGLASLMVRTVLLRVMEAGMSG